MGKYTETNCIDNNWNGDNFPVQNFLLNSWEDSWEFCELPPINQAQDKLKFHDLPVISQVIGSLDKQLGNLEFNEQISKLTDLTYALNQTSIVAITDAQGTITFINDKFCEISKYPREELMGQNHRILNSGYHPRQFFVEMWRSIARGETWRAEIKNRAKDNTFYWVDTTIVPFLDSQGRAYQYLAIRTDITSRKHTEELLTQANEELEARVKKRTADLSKINQELVTTIEELKRTQGQLIQAEKMSSLGQLVAGVAHEINNPVNFIFGNLTHVQQYTESLKSLISLYQQQYPDLDPIIQAAIEEMELDFLMDDLGKILDSMKLGTVRIRNIVLSLRNFSRTDESGFKAVDIHEGIDSTLLILQHRFKERPERPEISIIRNYGNLLPVECYASQLNQVFMNILANAIDAIEETQKGKTYQEVKTSPSQITITTSLISMGTPEQASNQASTQEPNWAQIAIADNGSGISPAIQQQIFNPFFTTKPIGKGTGMGMSISYQIITERHGGSLECISTPGQGTTFLVQIPLKHFS